MDEGLSETTTTGFIANSVYKPLKEKYTSDSDAPFPYFLIDASFTQLRDTKDPRIYHLLGTRVYAFSSGLIRSLVPNIKVWFETIVDCG